MGLGLKRVATGIVSQRNQTRLFAQLSKILLEYVNFDAIYPIFNIQKHPSKITRYEVNLPKEGVSSYCVV